jgi:hypothetical protein
MFPDDRDRVRISCDATLTNSSSAGSARATFRIDRAISASLLLRLLLGVGRACSMSEATR